MCFGKYNVSVMLLRAHNHQTRTDLTVSSNREGSSASYGRNMLRTRAEYCEHNIQNRNLATVLQQGACARNTHINNLAFFSEVVLARPVHAEV